MSWSCCSLRNLSSHCFSFLTNAVILEYRSQSFLRAPVTQILNTWSRIPLRPLKTCVRPPSAKPRIPSSPWYKKFTTLMIAATSAFRKAMIDAMIAPRPLSSGSNIPPRSPPLPLSNPSPIIARRLPDRADGSQRVHALLRLSLHVLRVEILARRHQRERPMVTHHVRHRSVRIRRQGRRVHATHVLHRDKLYRCVHVLLLHSGDHVDDDTPDFRCAL